MSDGPESNLLAGTAALLEVRGADAAARWLADAGAAVRAGSRDADDRSLRVAWAQAPRKLGRSALALDEDQLRAHGLPAPIARPNWRLFDLARVALLDAALRSLPEPDQHGLVERLLRAGELGEQESLLRGLALLPGAARYVDLAIDACRTNAVSVFAALAMHNPYPAAQFPDPAFNQMVLKSLFLGLPVAAIEGLEARADADLERMTRAYASEREAAGRPLSDDLHRVLALAEGRARSRHC